MGSNGVHYPSCRLSAPIARSATPDDLIATDWHRTSMTTDRKTSTSGCADGEEKREAPVLRIGWDAAGDPEHVALDFEPGK